MENKNIITKERAINAEYQNRIFEIYQLMIQGYTKRKYILQFITKKQEEEKHKPDNEKLWRELKTRQIDNYIRDATELFNEKISEDVDFEKKLALQRFEQLYTMNYKIQDYKECRALIDSRIKLLGIDPPKKIAETDSKGNDINEKIDLSNVPTSLLLELEKYLK